MKSLLARGFQSFTQALDDRKGWPNLPPPLGIVVFMGIRDKLRRCNLVDAGPVPDIPPEAPPPAPPPYVRMIDGTYNDLAHTTMGQVRCRFARNVPLGDTIPEKDADLLTPSPREVSRQLLTRDPFLPASGLNTLAGAWLQFEVHDWFSHGKNPTDRKWEIPLERDDDWWQDPMPIQRTQEDDSYDPDRDVAPTYRTTQTHWWDASQIYGDSPEMAGALRAHSEGRLNLEADGLPPAMLIDALDRADTGGAFWLGLGLFHVLFMREHNAICAALAQEHLDRRADDEWLYQHARLINSALMAKIHATEWSPALIGHRTTRWGTKIEWYGLAGKWMKDHVGRLGKGEMLSGIPGSPTNHHGVPYALSEEFVAVYRMHQLIPDDYEFFSAVNGGRLTDEPLSFRELGVNYARDRLEQLGMANSLYSFGISHPGQVTLHNYPRTLQRFERSLRPEDIAAGHEPIVDLAAIDILRNRERGVPPYNLFRERFHLRPAASFEDLTDNPQWAKEMRELYEGDINRVDLSVGLFAEPFPEGFAFSDTAFRVFILMATRRLKSDRFFTVDYRPDVYTPTGMRWVEGNTLADVLVRHYPELKPALAGVDNAFKPWRRAGR